MNRKRLLLIMALILTSGLTIWTIAAREGISFLSSAKMVADQLIGLTAYIFGFAAVVLIGLASFVGNLVLAVLILGGLLLLLRLGLQKLRKTVSK